MLEKKDFCDQDMIAGLKEIGFPVKTMKIKGLDNGFEEQPVPVLLYEAQKWLRTFKQIEASAAWDSEAGKWFWYVVLMDYPDLSGIYVSRNSTYDLYETALSDGIKEVIQKIKNGEYDV